MKAAIDSKSIAAVKGYLIPRLLVLFLSTSKYTWLCLHLFMVCATLKRRSTITISFLQVSLLVLLPSALPLLAPFLVQEFTDKLVEDEQLPAAEKDKFKACGFLCSLFLVQGSSGNGAYVSPGFGWGV